MKVTVFKLPEGRIDILVEASVGHGKPPVLLQGVNKVGLAERLAPVLEGQRGRRVRDNAGPGQ